MENVLWPIMRTIPVSNSPSEAEMRIFEMKTSTPGEYFPGVQLTSKASPDLFRLWLIRLQCSKGSERDIVGVFVGCLKKVPILSVQHGFSRSPFEPFAALLSHLPAGVLSVLSMLHRRAGQNF